MSEQNSMQAMSERAERLMEALSGALLTGAEAAVERIELATELARVSQRMAAFATALELVGVQKEVIQRQLSSANGPLAALYAQQIEMLTAQEVAILSKCGVPTEQAQKAIALLDAPADQEPDACGRQPRKRIVQRNGVAQG